MSVIGLVGMSAFNCQHLPGRQFGRELAPSGDEQLFPQRETAELTRSSIFYVALQENKPGGCRGYVVIRYPRCTAAVHDDGAGISRRRVRLVPGLGYED